MARGLGVGRVGEEAEATIESSQSNWHFLLILIFGSFDIFEK
jgi:hypothetical protein